jgi:myosin-light-chain kinase
MCKEKQSNREFAAKFIKVKMGQRDELRNEVMIMNALRHPKLLLLWDAFETRREMVLVMEQ